MRLIDADALMQSLGITNMDCDKCAWHDKEWSRCKRGGDFEDACCAIEDAPTIEQRKTGKWIDCDGSDHWKCDKCGCRAGYWFNEENSSSWELDMSEWLSDFCPNCGAKMGEGE